MKLEVGKKYKTRGGETAHVVGKNPNPRSTYPFVFIVDAEANPNSERLHTCSDTGHINGTMAPHGNDLVAEHVEPFERYALVQFYLKSEASETVSDWFSSKEAADRACDYRNNQNTNSSIQYRVALMREVLP